MRPSCSQRPTLALQCTSVPPCLHDSNLSLPPVCFLPGSYAYLSCAHPYSALLLMSNWNSRLLSNFPTVAKLKVKELELKFWTISFQSPYPLWSISLYKGNVYTVQTSYRPYAHGSTVRKSPTFRSLETCLQVVSVAPAEHLAFSASLHVTSLGLSSSVKWGWPGLLHKVALKRERDVWEAFGKRASSEF